jgi:hypothetical protein
MRKEKREKKKEKSIVLTERDKAISKHSYY